jgi:replication initiation protein RepC
MVHEASPWTKLPRLAPKLARYVHRPENLTWSELINAAGEWLRQDLGVSKSLWGEACLAMGRESAAVALGQC